jgi:hypothetical protein
MGLAISAFDRPTVAHFIYYHLTTTLCGPGPLRSDNEVVEMRRRR